MPHNSSLCDRSAQGQGEHLPSGPQCPSPLRIGWQLCEVLTKSTWPHTTGEAMQASTLSHLSVACNMLPLWASRAPRAGGPAGSPVKSRQTAGQHPLLRVKDAGLTEQVCGRGEGAPGVPWGLQGLRAARLCPGTGLMRRRGRASCRTGSAFPREDLGCPPAPARPLPERTAWLCARPLEVLAPQPGPEWPCTAAGIACLINQPHSRICPCGS